MIFWIFLQDDVQVPLLVSGISAFVNLHDFQVFQVIPMVWAFSNSGETSNHFVTSKDLGGSKNVFYCCIFWPWNYQGEWFWTGGLRGSRSLDHGQTKNMNLGRVGIAYLPTPPIIPWWSMHNCITDSATTSCPRNTHISMMAMMQSFCPQVGTGDHAPACDWEVPSLCCFFSSWRLRAGGAKKRLWAWVVCVYMYL